MDLIFVPFILSGLFICFFGIYFVKLICALFGFIIGSTASTIIGTLIFNLSLDFSSISSLLSTPEKLLPIVIIGLIVAVISLFAKKLFVVFSVFALCFGLIIFIASSSGLEIALLPLIAVAIVISAVIAKIASALIDVFFVLITAFGGAFIASLGTFGFISQLTISQLIESLGNFDFSENLPITIGALVLGLFGCIVQFKRYFFKKNEIKSKE